MKAHIASILIITVFLCTASSLFAESPYKISWGKDGYILGIGVAASTTGLILSHSVAPPTPAEVESLNSLSIIRFDRSATNHYSTTIDKSSDILAGAIAIAPLALFSDKTIRDDWLTISLMYIEVWSFIGGASLLSKSCIERYRPYVYNLNAPLEKKLISDAKMSFFSNHTITAFAFAVFTSTVYSDYHPDSEWKPYIWAGTLLTASIIGYLRYESGMHFPTDILVGAAIGSIIGYTIPWLHRECKENISVTPGLYGGNYGFSVSVKF